MFTMIIGTFFPSHPALAAFLIYLLGIIAAFLSSVIYTKAKKNRAAPPLTIELPKYRLPTLKNLTAAMNDFSQAPIYIDDTSGCTLTDIRTKCRRLKTQQKDLLKFVRCIVGSTWAYSAFCNILFFNKFALTFVQYYLCTTF